MSYDRGNTWEQRLTDSLATKGPKGAVSWKNIINPTIQDNYVYATGDSNIVYLSKDYGETFERIRLMEPYLRHYNLNKRPDNFQYITYIKNDTLHYHGLMQHATLDINTGRIDTLEDKIFQDKDQSSSTFYGYTFINDTNYLLWTKSTFTPSKTVGTRYLLKKNENEWNEELYLNDTLSQSNIRFGDRFWGMNNSLLALTSRGKNIYLGGWYGNYVIDTDTIFIAHDYILRYDTETKALDTVLNTRITPVPNMEADGINKIMFYNDSIAYANSYHQIYRTEDAWETFEVIRGFEDIDSPALYRDNIESFDIMDDETLILTTVQGHIYRYHHYPVSVEEELGDNDYINGGIVVYPQPALGGNLNVNTIGGGLLKLYSLTGKLLKESFLEGGMQTTSLDITELTSGSYLLVFQPSDGEVIMKNIVVGR
jgi:hypothetical protein